MTENLQFLVTGLTTGSVYALVGLGIVLVHQVTGIINFAQGDFVMLGALTLALLNQDGMALLPAAAIALGVAALVGVLVERLAIAPAGHATVERLIILTIGASITIQGITLVVVGTDPHFAQVFSEGPPLQIGEVVILRQYLWVFAITALAVLLLWFFLTRTMTGKAMRAAASNREAARIVAISPRRMSLLAFLLAALLGGLGGVVLAPIQAPSAGIGIALGLKGFTAAVLGGLNSPSGAIVGGLLIGVIESVAAGYLPSGYQDVIAFGVLFLVLLIRPQGLLRGLSSARV